MMEMNKKRVAAVLAMILLGSTLLVGCADTKGAKGEESSVKQVEETTKEVAKETAEEPAEEATSKTVTDMAGRTVEVPIKLEKVYGGDPVGTLMLYTLAPSKLLGWNYELNALEKKYILPEYQQLPAYGMGDTVNVEAIIKDGAQMAISVTAINEKSKASADKLQEQIGMPVVMIDSELIRSYEAYTFLGEVLGEEEKAKELAAYAQRIVEGVKNISIEETQRVKVYYGNGETSLNTAPKGSSASEVLDLVQVENVAHIEGAKGRVDISLEQLMTWNPSVMLINGEPKQDLTGNSAAQAILAHPDFQTIDAVKDKKVYGIPKTPFSWIDRPSGPNRLIGSVWLGELAYENSYSYDLKEEVKTFYDLFYHVELTDEEIESLLKGE